jgi:pyruvate formate lyase activating enzyme
MTALATLFNIQRFSTEDGPGIRTTLFFKGCPLACAWCQNPEGMHRAPETVWYAVDCARCGDCVRACPASALELDEDGLIIKRELCRVCATCVSMCGPGAIELIGKSWDAVTLLAEVLKDKTFYETSAGGITLSGGEPLLYFDFLMDFLPLARRAGLHVALDTCGFCPAEKFEQVIRNVDLVLYDIKLLDDERHKQYTGSDTKRILANAELASQRGVPMWVRTPVIPGHTDSDGNIMEIARLIRARLPSVRRFDLLAFSNLCASKYERLGKWFTLAGKGLLGRARMEELARIAGQEGAPGVTWSGPTID